MDTPIAIREACRDDLPRATARGSQVDRLEPPLTPGHLLGTNEFGRDLLSRVLWGARVLLAADFAVVIGGTPRAAGFRSA